MIECLVCLDTAERDENGDLPEGWVECLCPPNHFVCGTCNAPIRAAVEKNPPKPRRADLPRLQR